MKKKRRREKALTGARYIDTKEQNNDAMKEKSVVVTELHPKATEHDVLEMFVYCGPVYKIEIQKGKSAQGVIISNSAVVHYCDAAAAQMALLLTRAIILGKAVKVAEFMQEVPEIKPDIESTSASTSPNITPQLTKESSSQQLLTKPAARPSTPTFTPILSSIFSSSPPKPVTYELTTMTRSSSFTTPSSSNLSNSSNISHTPILSSIFSSSPPKPQVEPSLPPRSAPIPIKPSALVNSSSSITSISPSPSPSSGPSKLSPLAATTPSPQSTPPVGSLLDKPEGGKEKSTADELEEMLHISEKVETVTALATEIRQKASAEAKIFDEKYNITSKFNLFKAKAISFKNEVLSEKP